MDAQEEAGRRERAQLEGEKAAQQAQADREREAWGREREAWRGDRAQLEGEKVELRTALSAHEEAGRRERAQHEAQLQVVRRELQERMAKVRAATEM